MSSNATGEWPKVTANVKKLYISMSMVLGWGNILQCQYQWSDHEWNQKFGPGISLVWRLISPRDFANSGNSWMAEHRAPVMSNWAGNQQIHVHQVAARLIWHKTTFSITLTNGCTSYTGIALCCNISMGQSQQQSDARSYGQDYIIARELSAKAAVC